MFVRVIDLANWRTNFGQDMNLSTQLKLWIITAFFALLAVGNAPREGRAAGSPVRTASGDYLYLDCSDDNFAPVLVNCDEVRITRNLSNIYFGHTFEEGVSTNTDEDYFVLRSKSAPIVLPKVGYDTKDSWVFSGRKYFKYKRNVRTLDPTRTTDVIVVVGNVESLGGAEKVASADQLDAVKNIVLVFWYHPLRGVEAVGVTENAGAKAVYYCAERPCLFATEK